MVLDYVVTSNHIHLLVFDRGGKHVIPKSIQLVAGRTGQEYNERKSAGRAHFGRISAVENGRHLRQSVPRLY